MRIPSRRSLLFLGSLFLAALMVVVLFVPPPQMVLRWLIVTSAPFLLDAPSASESRIGHSAKELVRVYMNVGTCYHLAKKVLHGGGSDEEILGRMVAEARAIIVSPRKAADIRHDTVEWPALISGVGYCDQINAVVCRMATHHFPKAELVALYTPKDVSPHAIGRVWSEEKKTWLYFDAFFAKPVVFTRDPNGKARFAPVNAGGFGRSRFEISQTIYNLDGWTLSDFPDTFGMYLWTRLVRRGNGGEAAPVQQRTVVASASEPPATYDGNGQILSQRPPDAFAPAPIEEHEGLRNTRVFSRVVRQYAAVRVKHLFGKPDRNAYRAIARQARTARVDDRAAELTSIAARLAGN
ncbi:MAG TPA: hypothetical protein VHW00_16445 [Thermoanaerobaculia bacterium]|nr:hypothetical protein [Thermoanaerobaculia bacterium]